MAWSVDERRHVRAAEACTIHVPRGLRGHGIVLDRQSGPALVGRSQGGALIRLHARSATKTLTRWSGLALDHAVHPLQPLIAVQRDEGTIEIGDLTTGSC